MFAEAGSPSTGPLLVGYFLFWWRQHCCRRGFQGLSPWICSARRQWRAGCSAKVSLGITAVPEVRPCWERQELRGEGTSWDMGEVSGVWRGEGGVGQHGPHHVCVQCLPRTPMCSCTAVGSTGLCCSRSASCEDTECDGIKCLGERRNNQLLQSVFQRPSCWCAAWAFQSSSHLGKGKGPLKMLLFHLLAGLHFEYMFKNTLERVY